MTLLLVGLGHYARCLLDFSFDSINADLRGTWNIQKQESVLWIGTKDVCQVLGDGNRVAELIVYFLCYRPLGINPMLVLLVTSLRLITNY